MDLSKLLNIIGILVVITGAYIAARGFFKEKNIEIEQRTHMSFGNEEHFKAMIFQKYNEIFGFCLIIIGSVIQLLSSIEFSNIEIEISIFLLYSILVASTIIFIFLVQFVLDKFISLNVDIIEFYRCIKTIEEYNGESDERVKMSKVPSIIYARNKFNEIYNKRHKSKSTLELQNKILHITEKFHAKFVMIENSIENFKNKQASRKKGKV